MHPGFFGWWKAQHCGGRARWAGHCGPAAEGPNPCNRDGCGPYSEEGRFAGFHDDEGGGFGVRRPLRFLAHKLSLDESQVSELAAVLNELKTERAQAAVDARRRISGLADVLEAADFDASRAKVLSDEQARSAERLKEAVTQALLRVHKLLSEEQRKKLATLLRTGVVTI